MLGLSSLRSISFFLKIAIACSLCSAIFLISQHFYIYQYKIFDLKPKLVVVENENCWKEHFILQDTEIKNTDKNISFIPSSIEEATIGQVPSVPKTFFIEENKFCLQKNLKVIAYVHSAIKNVKNRQITRNTWVSSPEPIGTVFIVGKAKNKEEQEIIDNESVEFHDIVQGNYTDLYKLLTYKALNSLYWLLKNCEHVPWVIHADDDILIDVKMLFKLIHGYNMNKRTSEIFCYTYNKSKVYRDGKWKMTRHEYPCDTYPLYCSGPMWFSSMKVIKKLYANVPKVKYLWVDDTYLTGLVAEISHIPRTHLHFGLISFSKTEIGKQLAWLNLETNRTENWQSILSYYL